MPQADLEPLGDTFDPASLDFSGIERAEAIREPDVRELGVPLVQALIREHNFSTARLAEVLGCSRRQADRIRNATYYLTVNVVRLGTATGMNPAALLDLP
jgi:antitoxin component HigA of HigAB toxin-antitoxin module